MIKYITDPKDLERYVGKTGRVVQVDTETTGLHFIENELTLVQLGFKNTQLVISVEHVGIPNLKKFLAPILSDPSVTKIIHNALFDICFINRHLSLGVVGVYDTKLAEAVLTMGSGLSTSLGETLKRRGIADLDKSIVEGFVEGRAISKEMIRYAAEDVTYLEKLMKDQLSRATEDDKRIIALENEVVEVTARMRTEGFCFDSDKWRKIAADNEKKFKAQLKKMPKDVSNWNSEKQVKEYFRGLGINIASYADLPVIALTEKHKVFRDFYKLRELYQDVKLYGENWMTIKLNKKAPIQHAATVHEDRVHGNFNQILETGRFSSSQPNLQQLRATGDHRTCFHAAPKTTLIIADYTGQEIATAAVASKEYQWIDTILSGGSIHDLMAEQLFGAGYSQEQRLLTKRINFAILYGSGASTIAKNLLIPIPDAKRLIYKWKAAVPTLSRWLRDQVRLAETSLTSYSLYGRRRVLKDPNRVYTIAQNNPIQSTGADMLKLAMFKIHREFERLGWGRIVLCVHDELICEVPDKRIKPAIVVVKHFMEQAAEEVLGIPIIKTEPYANKIWSKTK